MLRNLVKKFRSQTLKDSEISETHSQLFEPRDSGTESDVEDPADNKSLAVSQTSDYRASQQSLFTTSSLAPSDQESNSWDSFGCESGIQVNCDNSASSFGAPPHPTYFQSDFRSLVSGFEGSDACEHSRLHNSAFKPVTKLSPSASLSVPLGSDGFRPTYLLSAESFCKLSSLGVAMLPPGCQLPEDIECCSAQEEGRHGHDFLIPKSPADLENKEIQRSFERLQAEMQELVAKDPQSPSDVRFVDDNLEDDDISMLKSPERLVSPTGKLSEADQQKPEIGVEPTGESQLRSPDSNNKTSGSDTTKLSQLCDQFSAKRKRSQSQGRTTSTYSAGPSHQPPTRGTGSSSVFSFMLESSLKESELSFAPDGSKCTSQAKLGFNDLQSAEVANITKASLRSGKLINNNNNSDRLPGEAESEGFKTVSSGSATPAREDQEVQELMNTSGPSCNVGGGGGPSEPRFFLRSSSCWKQTNNCDPSASALNVALKVEPVEEKLLPNGVSRDGCPYLFRLRPKRAPIKLLVPPQSPMYKNSFPSLVPGELPGPTEMDKLSPRKRTRGEMMAFAAANEQISLVNSRESSTSGQGAVHLSTSLSDSSIGLRSGGQPGTAELRPTLNFDKMREKMNKANTKRHCAIANAKCKFRNFASTSGRTTNGRNNGAEPVGCSFRPVASTNLSLPP